MELLRRTQRNQVLGAVVDAGFDAREFEWDLVIPSYAKDGRRVPRLTHKPSRSYFVFDYVYPNPLSEYAPAGESPLERQRHAVWGGQLHTVTSWLGYIKEEYETPDLWAELDELVPIPGDHVENTPFTPREQAKIAAQLREIREYIQDTRELSDEQHQALESRLAYLEAAATRLGRIDWRTALVGAMLEAVVRAVLPAEVVQEVLRLTLRGLANLFGGGLPELPA